MAGSKGDAIKGEAMDGTALLGPAIDSLRGLPGTPCRIINMSSDQQEFCGEPPARIQRSRHCGLAHGC